jgi:hypothetical protein
MGNRTTADILKELTRRDYESLKSHRDEMLFILLRENLDISGLRQEADKAIDAFAAKTEAK